MFRRNFAKFIEPLRKAVLDYVEREQENFLTHDLGYSYKKIWSCGFLKLVICRWTENQSSAAHDHGFCQNVSMCLDGALLAEFFRMSRGKLKPMSQEELSFGSLHLVKPHQIHCLTNKSSKTAVSIHFYAHFSPKR